MVGFKGKGWKNGVGLLGLSGMYGPISEKSQRLYIEYILDEYEFIDTASVYGAGGKVNRLLSSLASASGSRKPFLINKLGADLLNSSKLKLLIHEYETQNELFHNYPPSLLLLHRPSIELMARDEAFFQHVSRQDCGNGFGICTNSLEVLTSYHKILRVDVVQVALNLLDYASSVDLLNFCKENKITVHARSVLSSGLLSGKYHFTETFSFQDPLRKRFTETEAKRNKLSQRLEKVGEIKHLYKNYIREYEVITLSQFVYALTLSSPLVGAIIKGGSTLTQLRQNSQVSKIQDDTLASKVFSKHYLDWSVPY
ncbi:aldo/keto reductase [Pseudomonadales bacterium]|nr:aldo/keto reductase [Pseudomonadales bacterium]